ncbi:unnamed protein product, partial [Ixodes persulcatus]
AELSGNFLNTSVSDPSLPRKEVQQSARPTYGIARSLDYIFFPDEWDRLVRSNRESPQLSQLHATFPFPSLPSFNDTPIRLRMAENGLRGKGGGALLPRSRIAVATMEDGPGGEDRR